MREGNKFSDERKEKRERERETACERREKKL